MTRLILVCGSRHWTDREHIERVLREYVVGAPTIVHGANGYRDSAGHLFRGADALAGEVAAGLGLEVRDFPPAYEEHGPAATHIRNDAMLNLGPGLVIAFGEGPGTTSVVTKAVKRGIPVRWERAA